MRDCQAWRESRLATLELFEEQFVHVAPAPFFARLQGFDYRVPGRVKVFGRVLVLGRIAAADVAARFAQSQVHPTVAHLQTFFAALRRARGDPLHLIQMRAFRAHISPFALLIFQDARLTSQAETFLRV
jgi:hypothetical protein